MHPLRFLVLGLLIAASASAADYVVITTAAGKELKGWFNETDSYLWLDPGGITRIYIDPQQIRAKTAATPPAVVAAPATRPAGDQRPDGGAREDVGGKPGAKVDDAAVRLVDFPKTRPRQLWHQQVVAWHLATGQAVFDKQHRAGAPWGERASRYLADSARFLPDAIGRPDAETVEAEGKALIASGCDDPLVRYVHAAAQLRQRDHDGAQETLRLAVKGFAKKPYPLLRVMAAIERLIVCQNALSRNGELSQETKDLMVRLGEQAARALRSTDLADPTARQLFIEYFCSFSHSEHHERHLRDTLAGELDNGGVDPWLAAMIRGKAAVSRAWEFRGNGVASTVTEAGWKGMRQQLELAQAEYEKAWKLDPNLPAAPAELITVAMGRELGVEVELQWFNKMVAVQIDYQEGYERLTGAWRPRWGGSHLLLLAFGKSCLDTGFFDTEVPRQFVHALMTVLHDDLSADQQERLWSQQVVWDCLRKLSEGYLGEPSQKPYAAWHRTRYAAWAWRCGQTAAAAEQLRQLGAQVDRDLFARTAGEEVEAVAKAVGVTIPAR